MPLGRWVEMCYWLSTVSQHDSLDTVSARPHSSFYVVRVSPNLSQSRMVFSWFAFYGIADKLLTTEELIGQAMPYSLNLENPLNHLQQQL